MCHSISWDILLNPGRLGVKTGEYFTGFNPAISKSSQVKIGRTMRNWSLQSWVDNDLAIIAKRINPIIQGWINYYGKFYPSALRKVLSLLNMRLVQWVRRRFKRFRHRKTRAVYWLGKIASERPTLFANWNWGVKPTAG